MAGLAASGVHRDPILARIGRIQRTARLWALVRGWLAVALVGLCLLLAGVLLDHALTLQRAGREAFFGIFAASCAGGLAAVTLAAGLRRLSPLYVARQVERARPDLEQSLISYLQCRDDARVPAEVRGFLRRRAYPHLRAVGPGLLAHPQRTARLAWALGAAAALFSLYAIASPKSVAVSVRRLFAPAASILPPTRTRITAVEPGDVFLIRGDGFTVRARIRGSAPEHAFVVWDGASFTGRRVLLTPGRDGTWTGDLAGVLEDGSYYVVAGDTRSEQYRIAALPRPVVTHVRARLAPPAYTALPERTVEGGDLEAPGDTAVSLTARANLPPARGYLDMDGGEKVWMDAGPDGRGLRAEFPLTRSTRYRIVFETPPCPDGSVFRSDSSVTYAITCTTDQAPRVRLAGPDEPARLGPGATVQVEYGAQDDYGLVDLALEHSIGGVRGRAVGLPLGADRRAVSGVHQWRLADLVLRQGDAVEYWVRAADNWPRGPHVADSEHRRILIGEEARGAAVAQAPREPSEGAAPAGKAQGVPQAQAQARPPGERGARAESEAAARAQQRGLAIEVARAFRRSGSGGGECSGGTGSSGGGAQGSGAAAGGGAGAEAGEGASAGSGGASQGGGGAGQGGQGGAQAESPGQAQQGARGSGGVPTSPGQVGQGAGGASAMPGIGSPQAAGGGPGPQGEELSAADVEEILRELQQRLQAGEVPEEMLRDLGMNRDRLREIVERCLKDAHGRDGPPETAQAGEAPAVAGEILSARGDTAPDVTVESAAAEGRKDDLRARFEDASDRISRRYLDAVNAYYKRLSEER